MKIIFLDIDGVLNVIPQGRDDYGAKFHKHFEDNLRYIIENTDAKIVISSTWRFSSYDPINNMKNMWKDRNLAGEVIGITPHIDVCQRGKEIQWWLDNYPKRDEIETYCIIDDDSDMLESQMDNFVKTSNNQDHPDCVDIGYGLTKQCSDKVIKILNKW